jgi:hypothetical protein
MSKDLKVGDWIHNKAGNFVSRIHEVEKTADGNVWYHGPKVNYRKKIPTIGGKMYSTYHSQVQKISKPPDVQESTMKTFKELREDVNSSAAAQASKKRAKGATVSFDHHKHGNLSGTFNGVKRLGAHTYSHVEVKGKGAFYVPHHEIKEMDEGYAVGDVDIEEDLNSHQKTIAKLAVRSNVTDAAALRNHKRKVDKSGGDNKVVARAHDMLKSRSDVVTYNKAARSSADAKERNLMARVAQERKRVAAAKAKGISTVGSREMGQKRMRAGYDRNAGPVSKLPK